MPMPNFHAARQKPPGAFEDGSLRTKEVAPGVSFILGKLKGGDGSMVVQSVRFDKDKFTAAEARAWLKRNKMSTAAFEVAAGGKDLGEEDLPELEEEFEFAPAAGPAAGEETGRPQSTDAADLLVYLGSEVKALGDGKLGGYLIAFTDETQPDLSEDRDFFTRETDYDLEGGHGRVSVYYAHGGDRELGKRRFGKADLEVKDAGVWFEQQLALADEYEEKIYELAKAGKLRLSSGSVPHLVERERVGDTNKVLRWPIAEGSYTVRPAQPLCRVQPLKSFLKSLDEPPPPPALPDLIAALRSEDPEAAHAALKEAGFIAEFDPAAALKDATPEQVASLFAELGYTEGLAWLVSAGGAWQGYHQSFNEACTKEGRVLSNSKRETVAKWRETLASLCTELDALLSATEPKPAAVPKDEVPTPEAAALTRSFLLRKLENIAA